MLGMLCGVSNPFTRTRRQFLTQIKREVQDAQERGVVCGD